MVTLIVPSYNQGQFIENPLQSNLNQDYKNVEILVFDGGSQDNTVAILEHYADSITYVSKPDKGQPDAVNQGFKAAKGKIIGWLNSDDLYPDKRAISRMVSAFAGNPDYDFIYGSGTNLFRPRISAFVDWT